MSAWVTADKERELEKYQNESQIQIAGAEERAAEANAVASKAQLELARLKKPRTIAPEDQDRIIAELTKFTGQNSGFSVFPEPEPLALLRTLDAMLKSAGWLRVRSQIGAIVVEVAGNTAGTSHNSGVTAFFGPDNRDAMAALLTLSKALTVAGIPCKPSRTEQLRDKTPKAIIINVGKKP